MTEIRTLVKGEKSSLPVALVGGSGAGWVTADPAVNGLLVVPRCGVEAVILSESELKDFGYVKRRKPKRVSAAEPADKKGVRKRQQRDESSASNGDYSEQ